MLGSPAYSTVYVWARGPFGKEHPKLKVQTIDFDRLAERRVEAGDVFCCLGTTIDGKMCGRAKRLLVVSALGANADSRVFYNRVKGDMESVVRSAGVPTTCFFRPSLLSGPRAEARRGEVIGLAIGKVFGPLLGRYRPIHADLVAAAMLKAALQDLPSRTFESGDIRRLAQSS